MDNCRYPQPTPWLRRVALAVLVGAAALATAPPIATAANVIQDGGFELASDAGSGTGLDSPAWTEADSIYDSPICSASECEVDADSGVGPHQGANWAWFGGYGEGGPHTASLEQQFQLPGAGSGTLSFQLKNRTFEQEAGVLDARVDGAPVFTLNAANADQYRGEYHAVNVSLAQLAAGPHTLSFRYQTDGSGWNNLLVDDVALDFVPSNEFAVGKAKRNRKRGTAKLRVTVPGPGVLSLRGKKVKSAKATVSGPGTASLKVRAKKRTRKRLSRRGSARVRARIAYMPAGGSTAIKSKNVRLIKK